MRVYDKVEELQEVDKLRAIVCDWCKKEFKDDDAFNRTKGYEENTFTLLWEAGWIGPCDLDVATHTVELCHECREKLKELLKANGIAIHEPDW